MISAAVLLLSGVTAFSTAAPSAQAPSREAQARPVYCAALVRDDLERRRAMRPYLASTDPAAIAGTDAAIAQDAAALARVEAASRDGSGADPAVRQAAMARAAKDVSTLQSLQNAEDGCEATACTTRARTARDADPAWARLLECQTGVR